MNMERYGLNLCRLPESATGIPAKSPQFTAVCSRSYAKRRWHVVLKGERTAHPKSKSSTVGDFVMIDWVKDGESRIRETLPRSTFSRAAIHRLQDMPSRPLPRTSITFSSCRLSTAISTSGASSGI